MKKASLQKNKRPVRRKNTAAVPPSVSVTPAIDAALNTEQPPAQTSTPSNNQPAEIFQDAPTEEPAGQSSELTPPPQTVKKKPRWIKNTIVAIAGLALILAGYLVFTSWQNNTQDISTLVYNSDRLPATSDRPLPEKETLKKGEIDHLSIPDRGIEAPVIYITETNEEVYQEALTRGVVHFPGTALPGEYGNPYIFGHSSDYAWKPGDYKKVLKNLIDVPLETKVHITDHEGSLFVYTIKETKIVGPKDTSVLDQYNYERKMLTLQTSWPLNTALKRYIAIAELDEEATYGPINSTNTNTAENSNNSAD